MEKDEQPKNILIMEEDKHYAGILAALLMEQGLRPHMVDNGESGIREAQNKVPDMIILNITLPGMNGFKVIELLRENPETKKIPIIVLTDLGQKEDIDRCFELGANMYLIKAHNTLKHVVEHVKKLF